MAFICPVCGPAYTVDPKSDLGDPPKCLVCGSAIGDEVPLVEEHFNIDVDRSASQRDMEVQRERLEGVDESAVVTGRVVNTYEEQMEPADVQVPDNEDSPRDHVDATKPVGVDTPLGEGPRASEYDHNRSGVPNE